MDSSSHKIYHVHTFDSRQYLEHYVSDQPDMVFADDSVIFPIENLKKTFAEVLKVEKRQESFMFNLDPILCPYCVDPEEGKKKTLMRQMLIAPYQGHIRGDVMIDLSSAPLVHHLYAACEFFNHITVLKVSDRCIMELKRWLNTRTGAFDWRHVTKIHVEKENKSDQLQDKEEKVRSAVQHVMKCDLGKRNMTDPIDLPPADCIISGWLLDEVSKDQDDYIRYLRKFSGLLKPGGHLILLGCLGTTYYTVGKDKFHFLTYDEDFVRKALVGEGFVIDKCVVKKRTNVSDLTDYKAVIFIEAHKEK